MAGIPARPHANLFAVVALVAVEALMVEYVTPGAPDLVEVTEPLQMGFARRAAEQMAQRAQRVLRSHEGGR